MGVGTLGPLLLMLLSPYMPENNLDFVFAKFIMPEGIIWVYIVGMGLFATLAQVYMTKAYGESQAGIIGAVSYTNIVFSIVVGLILGDDLPDFMMILGIVFIVTGGLLVAKSK